ncbi:MAG: SpoIIE family protein phosphatase [Selenomonadaceae bacterium]|nr:SpoIIE family protein phosphatase [Selenomonadaceae bacterium]
MNKLIKLIIGREMTITKRINRVILFICVVLMVFFSFVTFIGVYNSKDYAKDISQSIGHEALETSSNILREQKQKDLIYSIEERTKFILSEMSDFYGDLRLLERVANEINQHPENFRPHPARLGREFRDSDVAALRYAPFITIDDLSTPQLSYQIDMLGNLQDLFYFFSLKYRNPDFWDAPTFGILTESGIGIMADSAVTLEQWRTSNDSADFWSNPLYTEAKKAWLEGRRNEPIYTSTYSPGINRNLGVFSCSIPYEVDGNFAGVIFFSILMDELAYLVEPATTTNDEFNFVLNAEGKVILSSKEKSTLSDLKELQVVYDNPPDIRESNTIALSEIAKKMAVGEKSMQEIEINGNQYYIAYAPIPELRWSLGVVLPANEVTETVEENRELIQNLTEEKVKTLDHRFIVVMVVMFLFALLIWFVVTTFIGRKLAGKFVKPIKELSDGVRDIAMGNFEKKLEIIKTGDEIESLSTTFNAMTDELQSYIKNLQTVTAEKERIAAELDLAKNIQQSMLPREFPPFPDKTEFDIYATMQAAKEVGGDFYDFYMVDENHLVITIADVSGKGVPAALFMMSSKTILKNFVMMANTADDLSAAITLANAQLNQNNEELMFVTVFLAMLNIKTGRLIYVNAAHNPPLIMHDGKYEYLPKNEKKVPPLGVRPKAHYEQKELQMSKGDVLFMYTDGVTEAENNEGKLYSNERLEEFLNSTDKDLQLEEILAAVRQSIKVHADGAKQSDDITMLAIRYKG